MKTIKCIVLVAVVTLAMNSTTFAGNMPTGREGNIPTGISSDSSTGNTFTDLILGLVSVVY